MRTEPDEYNLAENLQQQFLNIVEKMIENNVELPANFKLYYDIQEYNDKEATEITISPYLTKHNAIKASTDIIDYEGTTIIHTIVQANTIWKHVAKYKVNFTW